MSVRHSDQVHPGTVVLLPGPTDRPEHWMAVSTALQERRQFDVLAPRVDAGTAPYGASWIAAAAQGLLVSRPSPTLVLVAHGTAGPLLPALARAQRAARRQVGGYVFVDGTLPGAGATSHLDLLRAADPDAADRLHDALHGEGSTGRDHDFWTEPLPLVSDWPDAPCAYVRVGIGGDATGPTSWWARSAARRGWQVDDTRRPLSVSLPDVIAALPG